MAVYNEPTLGYGIDFATDYKPDGVFPDPMYDTVTTDQIEEVIWKPKS